MLEELLTTTTRTYRVWIRRAVVGNVELGEIGDKVER